MKNHLNNMELMKSISENTQIEEVVIGGRNIEVFIKNESDFLQFSKSEYYQFIVDDGFVRNMGENEDSQFPACQEHDYRENSFDSIFHFILMKVEDIERTELLETRKLPNLSLSFQKFRDAMKNKLNEEFNKL